MTWDNLIPLSSKMDSSLSRSRLARYVGAQAGALFPDGAALPVLALKASIASAFDRTAISAEAVRETVNGVQKRPFFSHLHSDHYAAFLYFLSNELYRREAIIAATKIYLLNKTLHALDIFYEIELPDVFILAHPVGTVLGRAKYGDFLVVMQNCTVGDINGKYPSLGKGAVLCAGSSVLGDSVLGDGVCVGAGSLVINADIPSGRTVVGRGKEMKILARSSPEWKKHFGIA